MLRTLADHCESSCNADVPSGAHNVPDTFPCLTQSIVAGGCQSNLSPFPPPCASSPQNQKTDMWKTQERRLALGEELHRRRTRDDSGRGLLIVRAHRWSVRRCRKSTHRCLHCVGNYRGAGRVATPFLPITPQNITIFGIILQEFFLLLVKKINLIAYLTLSCV